jgi:hypothetical protein
MPGPHATATAAAASSGALHTTRSCGAAHHTPVREQRHSCRRHHHQRQLKEPLPFYLRPLLNLPPLPSQFSSRLRGGLRFSCVRVQVLERALGSVVPGLQAEDAAAQPRHLRSPVEGHLPLGPVVTRRLQNPREAQQTTVSKQREG